ncbi:putative diacylglycerol acyltransferase [Neospora caninum Liverpool]|uniref:diacylglycerol O-acyltransferase n=1 Tax=Neospora caninum (strain Liverpool) TaxID=572307 RepID=F0VIC0_NEOCL|nr:putative diacylglycerol acyltransferase [Neospora caninum Liverpool]CBZ53481.1 putative diacylglycerol acyltransferase [Neospora caninum Liverpool]|eukprot:XP_003883513.1 putative diacylglycerol acyltransferase [Neospora caninum Liverpool]
MADVTAERKTKEGSIPVKRDARGTSLEMERKAAKRLWLKQQDTVTRLEELQRLHGEEVQAEEKHEHSFDDRMRLRSTDGSRRPSAVNCLHDYRGRPLHDQLHGAYRATLLSHHTKNLNLRGFLNLFFILLFVINFRMITDNLMEYGLMITLPSSFGDILSNWPMLLCFLLFYYPRVPRIRWLSVIRHVFESAACLALMKIVVDQHIVPVAKNSFTITEMQSIPLSTLLVHFLDKITRLSIPNLYVWLLMFVGLFHHWCNILAEVTRFGDRQFYLDWWNASSFGEYWRKWNLPIHHFLNRHINKPLRRARSPRIVATSVVFLISALLHEYMVTVPLQLGWTGWVFLGFMAQAPLTYITNLSFLGILIYWYLWGVKHGTVQQLDPSKIQIM